MVIYFHSSAGRYLKLISIRDTVSSVGIIRGDVFLSTSSSAAHACHFRHALALDELRVKFMPEYFHEMNSQTDGGKSKYVVSADAAASPPSERPQSKVSDNGTHSSEGKKSGEIKEVWFAGSHSDVWVHFGTHSYDTNMLRAEVVRTDPESRNRPEMSLYYGCAEKRLPVVSSWSRPI